MLALPLGLTAAGLSGTWWLVAALGAAIWWCSPRQPSWCWIIGLQSGLVGIEWAYAGAFAMDHYPQWFPQIASAWVGFPLLLVVAGMYARRAALRS